MEEQFSRTDLVSFGQYILSDKRRERIITETPSWIDVAERLRAVYHADVENWKDTQAKIIAGSNGIQVEADENLDQVSVPGEINLGPPL